MKINTELNGWFPEMVMALKKNRGMDSDYNAICKAIIESWLIDNEESFKKEFEELKSVTNVELRRNNQS